MGRSRKDLPLNEVIPGLLGLTRAFWPQIRGRGRLIALSALALFVSIGARLLEPWPLKLIFDWIIMPPDSSPDTANALWLSAPQTIDDTGMLLASFSCFAELGVKRRHLP